MSRLVNPIAFRLGTTNRKWTFFAFPSRRKKNTRYRDEIQQYFLISTFLKIFFSNYSIPLFSPTFVRNKKSEQTIEKTGHDNLQTNPFREQGFIFSKVSVTLGAFLDITCFLFDTELTENFSEQVGSRTYAPNSFFHPQPRSKYQALSFVHSKAYPKILQKLHSLHKIDMIKLFNSNQHRHQRKRPREYAFDSKTNSKAHFLKSTKILQYFPIEIFDNSNYLTSPLSCTTNKRFELLEILLLLLKKSFCSSSKRQLFFIILIKQLLLSLTQLENFFPDLTFFKTIHTLMLKEYSLKHLNFLDFHEEILDTRYLIYHGADSAIYSTLKSITKFSKIKLSFCNKNLNNLSASIIVNHICLQLGLYFTIQEILQPLIRILKGATYLDGFRIVVSGRLTRKERSAYQVRHVGRVTLNTKSTSIDFAADARIMRFGMVGVKVWLQPRESLPYFYSFCFSH